MWEKKQERNTPAIYLEEKTLSQEKKPNLWCWGTRNHTTRVVPWWRQRLRHNPSSLGLCTNDRMPSRNCHRSCTCLAWSSAEWRCTWTSAQQSVNEKHTTTKKHNLVHAVETPIIALLKALIKGTLHPIALCIERKVVDVRRKGRKKSVLEGLQESLSVIAKGFQASLYIILKRMSSKICKRKITFPSGRIRSIIEASHFLICSFFAWRVGTNILSAVPLKKASEKKC